MNRKDKESDGDIETDSVFDPSNPVFETCGIRVPLRDGDRSGILNLSHPLPEGFAHFDSLRREEKECDVTIRLGDGKEFRVHKDLLIQRSDFFRGRLTHEWANSSIIDLSEECRLFDASTITQLVDYLYTGRITISSHENAQNLIVGSMYLRIESIVEECARFLYKSVRFDDALPLLSFFREIEYTGTDYLFRFIDKNFVPISHTKEFKEITVEHLEILLKRSSLHVDSEEQVFDAVTRWIGEDGGRMEEGGKLLKYIRCTLLSESFLREKVEKSKWIMNSHECISYIHEAKMNRSAEVGSEKKMIEFARNCDDAHRLILVHGKYLLCQIGRSSTMICEIYDPVCDMWRRGRIPTKPTNERTNCVAVGTKIYYVGFNYDSDDTKCPVFDTQSNHWNETPPMVERRFDHRTEVINGRLYSVGGDSLEGNVSSLESFDPSSPSPVWSSLAEMKTDRSVHASCVYEGRLYVFGGIAVDNHRGRMLRDCEYYDPLMNTWTDIAPMKIEKECPAASSLNGYIYVVGGMGGVNHRVLSTVERYDPETDTWTTMCSMNTARADATLVTSCGKLFVLGGFTNIGGAEPVLTVEMYDVEKDAWMERSPMGRNWPGSGEHICSLPVPAHFPSPHFDGETASSPSAIDSNNAGRFATEYVDPTIPVNIPIKGFGHGHRIRIVGVPARNARRFWVNLSTPKDTAFRLNIRINDYPGFSIKHNFTRDSKWQRADRIKKFRVDIKRIFTFDFIAVEGFIEMHYDGAFFARFKEGDDPRHINRLEIEGDITVHSVHMSSN